MVERIERNPLISLLIICSGLLFLNLEQLQVTIMETRNFLVSLEMWRDGNWFLTTMNGVPRYEKPPAPAWFSVPFSALSGGNSLFWLRFPTSLMALGGILIVYFWVKKETSNVRISLISALILATSFYYLAIRFEGPSDTYTHVWMLSGVFAIHLFLKQEQNSIGLLLMAVVFTGLSILSKGPVGLYALFLPFLIAWFLVYKAPDIKTKIVYLLGYLLLSLILGGSWYVFVRIMDAETFIYIASRETGNWTSYNVRPFYYYWSFVVQSGVWTFPSLVAFLFYPWIKKKTEFPKLYRFSFLWTLLAVVLLSIIPEKKSRYLVPVLIPMAICTSVFIYTFIKEMTNNPSAFIKSLRYPFFGAAGLVGVLFPFSFIFLNVSDGFGWMWFVLISFIFVLTGSFLLYFTYKKRLIEAFYLIIAIHVLIVGLGMKAIDYLPKNQNYRSTIEFVNPENIPAYSFGKISPEVIWEIGYSLPLLNEEKLLAGNRILIFVEHENLDEFHSLIGDERNYVLFDSFDRNLFSQKGSRSYRRRHVVDVYLIQE